MIFIDTDTNTLIDNYISSPVRSIKARVEMYDSSSTLVDTFAHNGDLISFKIDRVGDDSKFFGFGISQKINIKLIDIKREKNITTDNYFKVVYDINGIELVSHPLFYTTEVHRDENTNELSITAYDALYKAGEHTMEEALEIIISRDTPIYYIYAATQILGIEFDGGFTDTGWVNLTYDETNYPNYDGSETLKQFLDDFANFSTSVYFLNHENALTFKVLEPVGYTIPCFITKNDYIDLDSKTNRRLTTIVSATELGDNISATTGESGTTQYIRDNPFLELRSDVATIVESYINSRLGGLTINQFDCSWRGNPRAELADLLVITDKENNQVYSYLLNDVVEYDGTYSQQSQWSFTTDENTESYDNPSTLGEVLKQTFAKVDKANKEITLLASQTDETSQKVAQLVLDTEEINGKVSSTNEAIDELSGEISTVKDEVAAQITSQDVSILITEALSNGIDTVTTSTGFTFNSDGLNITKSDSDISTLIDENGMDISIGSEKVLTADNSGVNAINLTARKYLIIGSNSRFEDYGTNRTGCFWIGG